MLLVQAPADIRASAFNPVYKWWNWVKLERGEGVKTVDIRWFHPQEPLFWKLIQAYGAVFEVPYLNLVGLSSESSGFSLAQKKYRVKRAIFTILFSCSKPTCFIPCRKQSRNGNTLTTLKLHSGLLFIYFPLQKTKTLSRVQKSIEQWNASYLTPQPTVSFGSRIFLFPLDTEIQVHSHNFKHLWNIQEPAASLRVFVIQKGKVFYMHVLRITAALGYFLTPQTSGETRHKCLTISTLTETGIIELLRLRLLNWTNTSSGQWNPSPQMFEMQY